VPSDGNARSGVNELRPGPIVTNAAAYEGTEVQYQRERLRRLFASVGSEEVKFIYSCYEERFAKESWYMSEKRRR
jgi:hypothetical protein